MRVNKGTEEVLMGSKYLKSQLPNTLEREWEIPIERNSDPNQQAGNSAPKAASDSSIIMFERSKIHPYHPQWPSATVPPPPPTPTATPPLHHHSMPLENPNRLSNGEVDPRFVWNINILEELIENKLDGFIIPLLQGNILKLFNAYFIRGSIPLLWEQIVDLSYKPRLNIIDHEQTSKVVERHFHDIIERYGEIVAVDLTDKLLVFVWIVFEKTMESIWRVCEGREGPQIERFPSPLKLGGNGGEAKCWIADAEENLCESEIREAHLAKSLFFIRIGDKEKALEQLKLTESKTVAVGQKMDLVFHTLQIGFFYMDFDLISKSIDKAKNIISLDRVSLKQKVVDAPEIFTVIGKIPHLLGFLNSLYDCQYKELSCFIAAGKLHCKIDKVAGVLETNRPDAKNALYQATIKQGDFLLNRIQKLSRVIDL
ncbi:hypothetical protein TEA_014688 [Camellia sinensis var. sinensis]|uniref:SAC domain-containing protein n=1 Tax=Camellia sinensis var. sinensis TaxID=542762 RepID=A0A4S4DW46_CAMSN|nr:hypothetical protein TEA_014688 [Camellia sinensis var. sinensis]